MTGEDRKGSDTTPQIVTPERPQEARPERPTFRQYPSGEGISWPKPLWERMERAQQRFVLKSPQGQVLRPGMDQCIIFWIAGFLDALEAAMAQAELASRKVLSPEEVAKLQELKQRGVTANMPLRTDGPGGPIVLPGG